MDDDHAPMAGYTTLIEQLCTKRSALMETIAAKAKGEPQSNYSDAR